MLKVLCHRWRRRVEARRTLATTRFWRLVAVVERLEGTEDRDVEVGALLGRELSKLDVELAEVGAGNLLVEILGQHVNAQGELLWRGPKSDLCGDLVGERARHDEGRVASGTAMIGKSAVG
jgi:hypothetical protein